MSTFDAMYAEAREPYATNGQFSELFFALEELLKRIADSDDPNIRRIRAKVRAELVAIRNLPTI